SSSTDNEVNFNQVNDTHQTLQNVIQRSITNNFTSNDVQTCNSQTVGSQSIHMKATDVSGGVVVSGITQDQAADVYSSCVQSQGVSNKITTDIMDHLGVKVENVNQTKVEIKEKGTAQAETVS